jgi:hypothetical protein
MLRLLTLSSIIVITLAGIATAQTPTKVPRYTDEPMTNAWYVEQARLWQSETARTPSSAQAWLNYYRAIRYIALTDQSIDPGQHRERVDQIADAMEHAVPNSYEYHLVRWLIGGNDRSLAHHLERALELNPDFAELGPDLVSFHELGGDREKVRLYARKWYETRTISPALLEYTYNVLASLDTNAIIFTNGDTDTYPIWLLQYARGIRPDVTVVNTSLILVEEYRDWLMREFEISGNGSLLDWDRMATMSMSDMQAEFIRSVATSTTGRPVYTALTVAPEQVKLIEKDLYVVGLANRYSARRLDNVALLERAWQRMHLDYLDGMAYQESYGFDRSWLPMINMNYVTPALLLFEHCSTAARMSEARAYRELILRLARAAGQEKELAEHLDAIEGAAAKSPAMAPEERHDASEVSAFARSISIYPNPSSREVTVSLPSAVSATMRLVSLDGTVLREIATSEREVKIDVSGYPTGSYLLKITTADAVATKRIEVKR